MRKLTLLLTILWAIPANGAISVLQSASSKPAGSPGTVTLSSALSNPSLIVVGINWGNNAGTYGVTDGAGNTYSHCLGFATGLASMNDLNCFWAVNTSTAASDTITVTVTGGGAHGMRLAAYEVSAGAGLCWPASPNEAGTSNNNSSSVTSGNSGSITPAATGEFLISFIQWGNTISAASASAPFSEDPTSGGTAGTGWTSDGRADGATDLSSPNTAIQANWTWTTAIFYSSTINAFATTSSCGGGSPPPHQLTTMGVGMAQVAIDETNLLAYQPCTSSSPAPCTDSVQFCFDDNVCETMTPSRKPVSIRFVHNGVPSVVSNFSTNSLYIPLIITEIWGAPLQ